MRDDLQMLLSLLRLAHRQHWTAHWQSRGPMFWGDHKMFKKLYEGLTDHIDTLAEKMIVLCGDECVDLCAGLEREEDLCEQLGQGGNAEKSLAVEHLIMKQADKLLQMEGITVGLDDFLNALIDDRETAVYMLTQRLK